MIRWPGSMATAMSNGDTLLHIMAGIGFPEGVKYILGPGPRAQLLRNRVYNQSQQSAYDFAVNGANGDWSGPTGDSARARFQECQRLLRESGHAPDVLSDRNIFRSWNSNEVLFAILATSGDWEFAELFMAHHVISPDYAEGACWSFLNAIQMCQARHTWFVQMPEAYRWALGLGLSPNTSVYGITPLDTLLKAYSTVTCDCIGRMLMKEAAIELLLRGGKRGLKWTADHHRSYPDPLWVPECLNKMEACRQAAFAVLCLQKRRGRIANNNRDVLGLLARVVWETRFFDGCSAWEPCLKSTRSKRACRGLVPGSKK